MLDYLKIKVFLMIVLKSFTYSCSCSNRSHLTSFFNETNNVKRDLNYEEYNVSTEPQQENFTVSEMTSVTTITLNDTIEIKTLKLNETIVGIRKRFESHNETAALINKTATLINETEALISKTIKSANETLRKINDTSDHIKEICYYYEDGEEFDLLKMADVWESKYYRSSNKIPCIRMHIKKTTIEERKFYSNKYGDFNGSLDWNNTIMEIKSKEYDHLNRRQHFLNGFQEDRGVLDNVIIVAQQNDSFKLHVESPDQWLVIKNLLLMRDCDSGEVIVFSKIPIQPSLDDLAEALETFGEEVMNGTTVCDEHNTV